MPSTYLFRQKGLRTTRELILRGAGKNSLPGISCSSLEQASTSVKSISPASQLGSFSSILRDRCLIDQQKAVPVGVTLTRTFALPLVPETSYQSCHSHSVQLLSESCRRFLHSLPQRSVMTACSSLLVGVEFSVLNFDSLNRRNGQKLNSKIRVDAADCSNWIECCRRVSGSLKNRQPHGSTVFYKCFWSDAGVKCLGSNPFLEAGAKYFRASSAASNSAGAAHDVSFDGSIREEQFDNSAVSSDQGVLGDRTLKLLSGSCYLPHPAKEETGGEDAHFICVDEQAIGVADGEEPKGLIDPARVLEKAYLSTNARGSSTACIIALTDQGIHAVNLGDSGFILVRDGCTIFRSPAQQHEFNLPYQLESGNFSDLPSAAQVFTLPVAAGDVIIAGTDGLFDNLYNDEVTAVVADAIRSGLGPQVTAQRITTLARQRAQDRKRQTPFSMAAQDAGHWYNGGKLDDITVVVSYIIASNK
uniref:Protein phosphatase n=1 Tax=Anthurium amnicola TaxID=1678845 RepID=A0A1D1XER6_9ARAE